MSKYYSMNVAGIDCDLQLCPVTEDLYIGAFVMFGKPKLTENCAKQLLALAPEYDYLITAEAKGIPLAYEMAKQHGDDNYFVARKKPKLYMQNIFEVDVQSITTEGFQKLYLDGNDAEIIKGKRILIVDDVISTGQSLAAIEKLVNAAGGIIVGKMAVLAEGASQNRDDLVYLGKLPLFNADGTVKND